MLAHDSGCGGPPPSLAFLDDRPFARILSVVPAIPSSRDSSLAGTRPCVPGACSRRTSQPLERSVPMADKEPRQPTHRAYSVIKREGQDDYWLNIGLVFPHKDSGGFNIMLQAFPLDGK